MTEANQEQMTRLRQQLEQVQKMETIGRLAVGIVHDFANLLAPIMSHTEIVGKALPPESELHIHLQGIQRAADHASRLAQQLLVFSGREAGEPTVLDLNRVVFDIDQMLQRLLGNNVELVTLPAQDLGRVRANAYQLEQVVINLVINARDAMSEGGTVTIRTSNVACDFGESPGDSRLDAYVTIAVRDDGVGMTDDVRSRVFEPFFTTKEAGKGTGLGLAICHEIVSQAGGHISVDTSPGKGSAFTVYLPRVDAETGSKPVDSSPESLPIGTETLLIVENVRAVREDMAKALRGQGYTVLEASNGHEALNAVRHSDRKIDLLLTDLFMPLMGGRDLANRLRQENTGLRVFYLSGYSTGTVGQEVDDACAPLIRKPFTAAALVVRVREVLDS